MSSESMLDKLDRYYREQNISVTEFDCKHQPECKAVCKVFVPMRSAFVGEEYEKGLYPRLLFVSSDSKGSPNPEDRTLLAMRAYHQNDAKCVKKSGHWYRTNALARRLLGETTERPLPFGFDMTCRYFAFTNSSKCKDFFEGQKESRKGILFTNCRKFVIGEVDILQPDIIVAQGRKAAEALLTGGWRVISRDRMFDYPDTCFEIIQLTDNRRAIKIVMKHPCAHWDTGEMSKSANWATKSVQEFVAQTWRPSDHGRPHTVPQV